MNDGRKRISGWPIGIVIVGILGVCGLGFSHTEFLQHFSEAIIIAAVLALAVDPFVKSRLLKEASLDIFHHLLGFDLPLEIRQRLKDIVLDTKLYRKDMSIDCSFTEMEGRVRIEFRTSYKIVNPTNRALDFNQILEFEKAENANLKSVWCYPPKKGYGKNADLTLTEEGILAYEGPKIKIASASEYQFVAEYSIELPVDHFYTQHFKYPTIGLTFSIIHRPERIKIGTDLGTRNSNRWAFPHRLFMAGDHFNIRWERSSGAT